MQFILTLNLKRLFLIAGIISLITAHGQDIHFTQFYMSPLTLNPAYTGDYIGNWRLMNNHRRQWNAISIPYVTTTLGADMPLILKNKNFSIGFILANDISGDAKLTINKFFISLAYHTTFNNQSLHIGLQPGYVMKNYSLNALTFPGQYDNSIGHFNSKLPNNELLLGDKLAYFDLNAGVAWGIKLRKIEPRIGLAMFHIIPPKETFIEKNTNKLPIRTVCSASGKYLLNNTIYITPNILYMSHAAANDLLVGANAGYVLSSELNRSIYFGLLFRDGYKRNPDALAVVAGIVYNCIEVGISYDINISKLNTATNYRGGLEFAIIYKGPTTLLKKLTLPCDRF